MTFTLADIINILSAIGSLVVVYVNLSLKLANSKKDIEAIKEQIKETKANAAALELKVDGELKELNKIDVERTLALQENTLAIKELRKFIQKLEEKFDSYSLNMKNN